MAFTVAKKTETLALQVNGAWAEIIFSGGHKHNPFSIERMQELCRLVDEVNALENVKILTLYGGPEKSFSAGGDFNEVHKFNTADEVYVWIDSITDLYRKIVNSKKVTVAAIDNHAIGLGLQIALCCDYRLMSSSASVSMPELEIGVSCIFGAAMLEFLIGRNHMQELVFLCEKLDAKKAFDLGIVHEVVEGDILNRLGEIVGKVSNYNSIPLINTKIFISQKFSDLLANIADYAKKAHAESFANKTSYSSMTRILGKNR